MSGGEIGEIKGGINKVFLLQKNDPKNNLCNVKVGDQSSTIKSRALKSRDT